MPGRVRIGISGWRYAPWRGVFYPRGLRHADELAFAAQRFDSVEINGSFYSLQSASLYTAWRKATPPGFVFAVKGSRFITHMKRLREIATPLANFFASGLLCLEEKLGPLLWQFPPNMAFDERFAAFFAALPRTTGEAAALAARHDGRVADPVTTTALAAPLRHAVEVRHPSFCVPEFVRLLRRENIALVVADSAGRFPYCEDTTADFAYVRLHGDTKLYESGYSNAALRSWAQKIRGLRDHGVTPEPKLISSVLPRRRARDVYVYFDNDAKVHAPFDAENLARSLEAPANARTAPAAQDALRSRRSEMSSAAGSSRPNTRRSALRAAK
jgi:uncharacterized protein YecE (DUF72 family)